MPRPNHLANVARCVPFSGVPKSTNLSIRPTGSPTAATLHLVSNTRERGNARHAGTHDYNSRRIRNEIANARHQGASDALYVRMEGVIAGAVSQHEQIHRRQIRI